MSELQNVVVIGGERCVHLNQIAPIATPLGTAGRTLDSVYRG